MKIAIHQPEYWPLPRLLAKWASVDLLILLDTVDFNRESLQHRARLLRSGGPPIWLTIPFRHVGGAQRLRTVEPADVTWPLRHLAQIREWYRGLASPKTLGRVADWYHGMLPSTDTGLTLSVAQWAGESMDYLGAHLCGLTLPPVMLASALQAPPQGWGARGDLVLNLCRAVGAKTYLAGARGAQYLDYAAFDRAGISIEVQAFAPVGSALAATQHTHGPPGTSPVELSALHLYLVEGPEAVRGQVEVRR